MRSIPTIVVVVLLAPVAQVDGRFYPVGEEVPPDLPYQRAMLAHQDGIETLVLQSRLDLAEDAAVTEIGWVVPVPAAPRIASLASEDARFLFDDLDVVSAPRVHPVGSTVLAGLGVLLGVLICARALWRHGPRWMRRVAVLLPILTVTGLVWLDVRTLETVGTKGIWIPSANNYVFLATGALTVLALLGALTLRLLARRSGAGLMLRLALGLGVATIVVMGFSGMDFGGDIEGVEIVNVGRAGLYDVAVVRVADVDEFRGLLRERGFRTDDADGPALARYVSAGWQFVTAKIRPGVGKEALDANGLPDPLVLQFESPKPIYPLALTATMGQETEVLLYVLAEERMSAGDPLETRFAGRRETLNIGPTPPMSLPYALLLDAEPEGALVEPKPKPLWLTKLKGRLTPEQMAEDLVLEPVDSVPHQEHVWIW